MTAREQMQLRCFSQKQRETILQTLRHALRVKSDADLPKVFQLPVAVALKPGSWEELNALLSEIKDRFDQLAADMWLDTLDPGDTPMQ